MKIQSLKMFIAVARCGSFAKVARLYGKDASAVSRAIASLENQLGTKLFKRTTRRIELTDAGALFFERMEPLLLGIDEAEKLICNKNHMNGKSPMPEGHVRLLAPTAMGQKIIIPLLAKFKKSFPMMSIELALHEGRTELGEEKFDLAISSNQVPEPEFISRKLKTSNSVICASPKYLQNCPPLRTPQNLENHKCLIKPSAWLRTQWKFFSRLGQKNTQTEQLVLPVGDIFISNDLARINACIAGLGPSLFEDWMIQEQIENEKLVNVFPFHRVKSGEVENNIWLIFSRKNFLPEKTRLAIEFFKHHIEGTKE